MQDEKADSLYKKFGEDFVNDNRIRLDLKRHNWLLMKIVEKLSNRGSSKAPKNKPISPVHKAKSAPKLRPTLPVSLPLSYHHKFLRTIERRENGSLAKQSEKKSLASLVKKNSITSISHNTQENKNSSTIEKTNMDLPHSNYVEVTHVDKFTDSLDLVPNAQSLHVIKKNYEFDKNKLPVPAKEVSVQVHENGCHVFPKDLHSSRHNKIKTTTIPLSVFETETQTEEITVICGHDVNLLTTVKRFNFTIEDLERFYQITLENNNNEGEFEDQNEKNCDQEPDQDDLIVCEPIVSNNNENKSDENTNQQNVNNNLLPNFKRQIIKRHCESSSLATGLFERLKLWSDLNKVILRTFYEGIFLLKEKGYDEVSVENNLSQLSQNLVDQICDMITTFNDDHGKQFGKVVKIIELDDCDEKRRPQDDTSENGQINDIKKKQTDAQPYQEYTVKNNQVFPNMISRGTQYQAISYQETEQDMFPPHNQITQTQGHPNQETPMALPPCGITPIQNTENQPTQYQKIQIVQYKSPATWKPGVEIPTTPNYISPTKTQIFIPTQLLPAQMLQNIPAAVNEVRYIQNQIQNVPPNYQDTRTCMGAVSQRSKVLREFRINSISDHRLDRNNKNDARLPNYHNLFRDQRIENTFYPQQYQNVRKQQKPRKKQFRGQTYPQQWYEPSHYHDYQQNSKTPTHAYYQIGNRIFQNLIQQNPQYNSSVKYQNTHPYNYRTSYTGEYRRW